MNRRRIRIVVGLALGLTLMMTRAAWVTSAGAGTVVSGTVSGSDVGFLTGASVVLDGSPHQEAHTDADGRFTMNDVARGRYQVRVSADGYLPIERSMEVGTASVSFDVVLLRLPGLP